MIKYRLVAFPVLLIFTACQTDPMEHFSRARQKIDNHAFISYRYLTLWPNPAGMIDTLAGQCTFRKHRNDYFDYDYVATGKRYDILYIGNEYKEVNHNDSVVTLYSPADLEQRKSSVARNIFTMNSPLTLLADPGWLYLQDTTSNGRRLINYRRVEMDTLMGENKVYVDLHLFLDPSNDVVARIERRAFLNGQSSQTIVHHFTDYRFEAKPTDPSYRFPDGYISRRKSEEREIILLAEGQAAPDFNTRDIDGNPVSLKSFRGEKVLLDFSVINCGYCKLALEHFNQPGFKLPFKTIYLNPEDGQAQLLAYRTKVGIPFPAVADAEKIGRAYGVSGFPTFFLINENGLIEKAVVGYRPELMEGFRQ